MTSAHVNFAGGRCIIDVEPQATDTGLPRFVAHLSLVDGDGTLVRPLVGPDGRWIRIHATSERLALRVATSYLEGRFGRLLPAEPTPSLATATVGAPYVAG